MSDSDDVVVATSYEEFANVMAPRLFRAALLLCGDWHLAEDLTQTTLAKLFVAWRRVRAANSPEAYARGALAKTYLSHRRLRRASERPVAELGDRLGDESVDRAEVDTKLALFAALRSLGRTDRLVVVLRYWEDRSVAETAALTGLSETAVRARSSRALGRLRGSLADWEVGS